MKKRFYNNKMDFKDEFELTSGLPHYCAVLNNATVTGSQKFGIFVYNAEALELTFEPASAYAVYNVFSCKNKKNNHWQNDYG